MARPDTGVLDAATHSASGAKPAARNRNNVPALARDLLIGALGAVTSPFLAPFSVLLARIFLLPPVDVVDVLAGRAVVNIHGNAHVSTGIAEQVAARFRFCKCNKTFCTVIEHSKHSKSLLSRLDKFVGNLE